MNATATSTLENVPYNNGKCGVEWLSVKSKAPVSQLVNADDTSVIEIKTQLYLES